MENSFLDDEQGMNVGLRPFSEAWIRYIIEYHMPDMPEEEKREIIVMLKPVVDVAAKAYIKRHEIPMHLDAYDIIWDKYFMYMKRGKYDPRLLILRESLREGFELQLTRSVDARQMSMIFEPKQSIFQRLITGGQRKLSFFKGKKTEHEEEE